LLNPYNAVSDTGYYSTDKTDIFSALTRVLLFLGFDSQQKTNKQTKQNKKQNKTNKQKTEIN